MISILVPTKKRPNNLIRFVDNIATTADNVNDIELCLYLDDDDDISIPAVQQIAEKINTQAIQGNLKLGSQMYNELYKLAQGKIYMISADDIIFKNKGWDTLVKNVFEKYEDKILYLYGEDGFQHGRIGTHGFIHSNWIDILGYTLPWKLSFAYVDEWLTELAARVGRNIYLPELVIEHLHPCVGKAPNDETYNTRAEVSNNLAEYYKSLEPDRIKDAERLRQYIKIFES